MLKTFRNNLKTLSPILWVVIAVFVLAIFYDFGTQTTAGGGSSDAAATAGPHRVTMNEFRTAYTNTERQYRQMYGQQFQPEMLRRMGLPLQVLNDLMGQKILLAEARGMGLEASDREVRDAILEFPLFKDETGRFIGEERYQETLRRMRLDPTAFERDVRDSIVLDKLQKALQANVFVSDGDVERAYRDEVERAKVRFVRLSRAGVGDVAVTPQEVAAYYQRHQNRFRLPEQRQAAYLLVEPFKMMQQATPSAQEVQSYYDEHADQFTREEEVHARHVLVMVDDDTPEDAAKVKIDAARRRLEAGEDFAKVAAEVSEDTSNKDRGGDLGFFARGRMVKPFEDAAFLASPNVLMGPIRTDFGWHLLEVLEKRAGGKTPLAETRPAIEARLAAEKVQELARAKAEQLGQQLRAKEPDSPADVQALVAGDPAVIFGVTTPFAPTDPVSGLGRVPAFTTAAFSLPEDGVSQPVQLPNGWSVLWLQKVHAPRVPALSEIAERVRQTLVAEKQGEVARARLEGAKQQLGQGKTLDQVAAELGLAAQESGEFGRDGSISGLGHNPELARQALAMSVGQVGGPIVDPQGTVLYQVTERKAWNPQEFRKARTETRERLEREQVGRLVKSIIEERQRELGLSYNPELLELLGVTGEASQTS